MYKITYTDRFLKSFNRLTNDVKVLNQIGVEEFCKLYENSDNNSIPLPGYNDIHHNEIMREFVREFIEEKETRKRLFYILRRVNYMDDFINTLKDFDLYEKFEDVYSEYYGNVFEVWRIHNKIEF